MPAAILAVLMLAAPAAWAQTFDAQAAPTKAFPERRALRQATKPEITALEARLDAEALAGADRRRLILRHSRGWTMPVP